MIHKLNSTNFLGRKVEFTLILLVTYYSALGQTNLKTPSSYKLKYKRDFFFSLGLGVDQGRNDKTNDWLASNGLAKFNQSLYSFSLLIGKTFNKNKILGFEGRNNWVYSKGQRLRNLIFSVQIGKFFDHKAIRIIPDIGICLDLEQIVFNGVVPSSLVPLRVTNNFLVTKSLCFDPRIKFIKWHNLVYRGLIGKEATETIGIEFGARVHAFQGEWVYGSDRVSQIPKPSMFNPYVSISWGFW